MTPDGGPREGDSLASALLAFQGEVGRVAKDATNPHFHNKYASLPVIMDTIRPALQANGLAISQMLDQSMTGAPALRTVLLHPASGERLEGTCPFPAGLSAQQMGSAVTYFRRYGVLSALGLVADEDDDGYSASGASAAPTEAPAGAVSSAQHAKIGVLVKELDRGVAPDGYGDWVSYSRAWIGEQFGKHSRKDLTAAEASSLINMLQAAVDQQVI